MSDYINRRAAIDAVNGMPDCPNGYSGTYDKGHIIAVLEDVPSVQTEQSSEIQDILEYLDTVLHPIISPDHWNVYSELHDMISMLPSAQPIDVQEAYYRGKIDGIKECTTRLKKMNEEFANGRHDLQTSGDRCAEPTS